MIRIGIWLFLLASWCSLSYEAEPCLSGNCDKDRSSVVLCPHLRWEGSAKLYTCACACEKLASNLLLWLCRFLLPTSCLRNSLSATISELILSSPCTCKSNASTYSLLSYHRPKEYSYAARKPASRLPASAI